MKQNTALLNPSTRIAIALLVMTVGLADAHAATPTGIQINPTISNTQTIELVGGSTETASWTAPAAGSYNLWVQIPASSTASTATYNIYPKGNAVGNTACSSTDPIYPCYQAIVNQALASNNGWAQLMVNNPATSSWTFTLTGFVSTNATAISRSEQLGIAQMSFQSTVNPPPLFTIGQSYQGGKIFYIDSTKQHGLIAAPSDQSTGISWDNGTWPNDPVTGATGTAIGTGQANTTAIIKAQGAGSYAAKLCDDLVLGGYSDWYLPSKDELNQLYLNQAAVGGFANFYYWSSSEYGLFYSWYQYFGNGNGTQDDLNKFLEMQVRAIRAF